MRSQRGSGSGLPERSQEHVIGHVLRDAAHRSHSTSHLTNVKIERVHDDADPGKPTPDDRGDRETIRAGKDLVDHEHVRQELSAQLDALASVLGDAYANQVALRVDEIAQVL